MTAPMSALPMTPATGRAGSSTGGPATGSAENAAGFASALDDVLHGAGTPSRRPGNGAGGASGGASGEGTDGETPATPVAVPVDVPPGLWALLAAGASLGTTPGTQPEAAAAAALIGAVTGATATGGQPLGVQQPGVSAPVLPLPTVTDPAAAGAEPAAPAPGTPAALLSALGLAGTQPATAPAGTTGADAAGLPADLPVVVLPATAGDTADTGTGPDAGPGHGSGSGSGSGSGTTEPDAVGLVGGATASPTAVRTDPLGAAGPTPPAAEPPVAQQLGRQLAVLSNAPDGSSTMTLVITPEELGPVSIQVTVTDGSLDLTLQGGSDAGRHALTDALPELRRELEGAGLTLGRLAVDDTTADLGSTLRSAQQQLLDARAGQQGQGSASGQQGQPGEQGPGTRTARDPEHRGEGSPALATEQSASSGVDVLA
ncbi:flagellar hook-length control protein FliK [Modestobacter sp. SYSU DS0657]